MTNILNTIRIHCSYGECVSNMCKYDQISCTSLANTALFVKCNLFIHLVCDQVSFIESNNVFHKEDIKSYYFIQFIVKHSEIAWFLVILELNKWILWSKHFDITLYVLPPSAHRLQHSRGSKFYILKPVWVCNMFSKINSYRTPFCWKKLFVYFQLLLLESIFGYLGEIYIYTNTQSYFHVYRF